MIRNVYLCRRRPDLTRAEYARRVLEGHAPLALEHHPAMRRYVIHIVEGAPPGTPEVDSVPSLWFDSVEAYRDDLYDSDEGREIIRRDVQTFMGGADAYATREEVHLDRTPPPPARGERSPGVKWIVALRRRPELTREAFVARWRESFPIVAESLPTLARYLTCAVERRLGESGEDWDGFAEYTFARPEDAPGPDAPGLRALSRSEQAFVARAHVYFVGEYVQK